ncbi:S-layer protein [[Clostridium] sordellii]|uniref:S-layer homology domain-containing protein n=2 Tax=Paraclostridium sordellii TaxID=1505 RepID=UPI0005E18147|nr:S-layer homology domain-containing protein [Paeniclostridium sordellii]MDU4413777.1 S-layer homology domain-containing protein [Paeniclostridium sordellii]MVO74463.1 hypothetical protein [Paeniclostridium sordellii]CEO34022.1 S-layer protein [[Clostridium] sordellii] [Paeniclostridium sordellii]CEP93745.1 S-layer protein [[Clostridium] sordellii] [Paeniclostridium sordellii]CEQ05531.1 S-layer protein [[Clostridium] sordellii] [Paeniclostridium sordellii]
MHKKIISTIVIGITIGSTSIASYAQTKINDINGHWACKEITEFINKGDIKGYGDGTFRPDNYITRAEFIKIVNHYFRFFNRDTQDFLDVNKSDWFYNDVCVAERAGYINGYEDGKFKPNKTITREEAAKILVSILHKRDYNYDKITLFSDGNKVSNWAKSYVEGAIEGGYMKGDNNRKLNPNSNITRAESVAMISRIARNEYEVPDSEINNVPTDNNINANDNNGNSNNAENSDNNTTTDEAPNNISQESSNVIYNRK